MFSVCQWLKRAGGIIAGSCVGSVLFGIFIMCWVYV